MSSFKRRGTSAAAASSWPAGVRPSSFSSPVPLVSTGVPALDDILSGGGLSSGSILTIIPATGTAALSAAQIGSSATSAAARAESDHISRAAAEPYAELLLAYSVAQGIAARHRGIAIGESVDSFAHSLMARAGDFDEKELERLRLSGESVAPQDDESLPGPSERLGTVPDEDNGPKAGRAADTDPQSNREMKIAWRYEKMTQFKTTVEDSSKGKDEAEAFCSIFDLSRRMSPRLLSKAKADGFLETVEIDFDELDPFVNDDETAGSSYDLALARIRKHADLCRQYRRSAPTSPLPVLRVAIRSLGSPCWRIRRGQRVETELVRFLLRLKNLIRSLALPGSSGSDAVASSSTAATEAAIPAIATITLSPYLLSAIQPSSPSPAASVSANLIHRVSHVSDACISLSAFAPSPALRSAFPSYTGALKVLKTPALGTLTNPSIRASVLRGMGAGAAARGSDTGSSASALLGGSGAVGEGGAGGGENNLAFKVRRKRLVIETLHLDVEGGVSERRTKPPKNMDDGSSAGKGHKPGRTTAISSAGSTTIAPVQEAKPRATTTSIQRRSPTATSAAGVGTIPPASASASASPVPAAAPPRFAGLKSLRERGLAAASQAMPSISSHSANDSEPLEVELDTRRSSHGHSHGHGHGPLGSGSVSTQPAARRGPVFKSDKPEDYEF
ncbi:uncharacterized protein PFL1_03362 [Pseudozyma flocculosa PF-1]|uniref:Elongator complex protein 4 n=2 Tax=Pseudozyma flocculosa TaxID=84751 RepID=A0A5C3F8L0_9BASI|nr:uncharacterized protein PFL1_03362 [Pseudozyma flocculosa PF-1]EPQ29073.1 hypothetical protein PFL1_03362 [Pseudozyma flocculosa PF-1]SPO40067.1 uncharacterized protein PSFLO_05549 [Pseudozyma flocculosa]